MATHSKPNARTETDEPTRRLAVLIDADNAQASVIGGLLAEVARFGEATVKRIYGDFTSPASAQWKKALNQFAIKPVQQFAYTSGKSATDGTLIIDGMDLLYTRRFDGFCLVSSDSDFTGPALRIGEEGLTVYGFGEQKTPEAFRNACHKFVFTEVLRPVAAQALDAAVAREDRGLAQSAAVPGRQNGEPKSDVTKDLPESFFRQALEQADDDSGRAHLGTLGGYLNKLRRDSDSRNFGYKKLSDLVKARADLFVTEERTAPGSSAKVLYVRAR